ncbi:HD domain-containing protein [Patescibacteria group bacterium]
MEYTDKIYGKFSIDEPVVEELISSKPLQRLKNINQYGASFYRFPHLTTTRFEHSLGVYYVLRQLGAPLMEQVFGLLHDIPHTVFSHVSDIVFEDTSQAFHEKFHEKIIFESDIPRILKKHGLSVWELSRVEDFRLAERDFPDLCADRIDYFFRDCVVDKQLELGDARKMLGDLSVHEGDIVFHSQDLARQFALTYRAANDRLWAHPLQSALYHILAAALKLSIEEGIVTFDDLFTTDQEVYDKMKQSGEKEITKLLAEMENVVIKEDDQDFDYHVRPKVRLVDPYVLVEKDGSSEKVRLSDLDPTVKASNEEFIERLTRGYYVKVLS